MRQHGLTRAHIARLEQALQAWRTPPTPPITTNTVSPARNRCWTFVKVSCAASGAALTISKPAADCCVAHAGVGETSGVLFVRPDLILRATRGEHLFSRPRWPEPLQSNPDYAQLVDDVLTPEREFERELERWLVQRRR